MASPDFTQELTCSICLEIFTHPVSLECGHHFCSSCISQSWQKVPGDVSCPQCRQVFTQRNVRPARTLINIVEKFREVKVTQPQEEFYCQEHEEKLKLFCEDEHKAICVVCGMSRAHKTHSVIPIKEAAQIYKNKLETSLETVQKQMDLSLHSKREREDGIFHMKAEVDRLRNEINSEFEKMHKFLFEKEELMKAELERKSNKIFEEMENNLTKTMDEMSSLEGAIRDLKSRLEVQEAPEFLKDIQDLLMRSQMEFHKPGTVSTQLPVAIAGEPFKYIKVWREMRAVISPVPTSLTLDPETAHNKLIISQDLTSVRDGNEEQDLPDHPGRFDKYVYVLSSQSFTSGRHYWEVGLGNKPYWVVGVCRESVNRKGEITRSPENGFWVIAWLSGGKSLKIPDVISQRKVKPRKLGIYLDYEGGQVSFYDAEDMSHLYTFTDTFIEKLYPIFNPCNNNSGDNPEPLTLLSGKSSGRRFRRSEF
ncbi:zinc-binding protein A33-like isoform X2 [Scyliorhinus canicula]|uniref:zinc-binding protein A33-like isoform X2 n=1 Tax=Scyliorhinus canicula TaxID=7830 RepID=UPI0018F536F1|nr:zinc-binding protein A33-like isoform X2 [Scyliorhinus canicula]